jgi:hypothetical protein
MNSTALDLNARAIGASSYLPETLPNEVGSFSKLKEQVDKYLEPTGAKKDQPSLFQQATDKFDEKWTEATKLLDKAEGQTLADYRKAIGAAKVGSPEVLKTLSALESLEKKTFTVVDLKGVSTPVTYKTLMGELLSDVSRSSPDPYKVDLLNKVKVELATHLKSFQGEQVKIIAEALKKGETNVVLATLNGLKDPTLTLKKSFALTELKALVEMKAAISKLEVWSGPRFPGQSLPHGVLGDQWQNSAEYQTAKLAATRGTKAQVHMQYAAKSASLATEATKEHLKLSLSDVEFIKNLKIKNPLFGTLAKTPFSALVLASGFLPFGIGDALVDGFYLTPGLNKAIHSGNVKEIVPTVAQAGVGIWGGNFLRGLWENSLARSIEPIIEKANLGAVLKYIPLIPKTPVAIAGAALTTLAAGITAMVFSPFKGGETAVAQNPGIQAPSLTGGGNPFQNIQEAQSFVKGIPGAEEAMKGLSGIK